MALLKTKIMHGEMRRERSCEVDDLCCKSAKARPATNRLGVFKRNERVKRIILTLNKVTAPKISAVRLWTSSCAGDILVRKSDGKIHDT